MSAKAVETLHAMKKYLNGCMIEADPAAHMRMIVDKCLLVPIADGGLHKSTSTYKHTETIQGNTVKTDLMEV